MICFKTNGGKHLNGNTDQREAVRRCSPSPYCCQRPRLQNL